MQCRKDITLESFGFLGSFKSWEVSFELSLPDHRHFLCNLEDCVRVGLIRKRRVTIRVSFQDELNCRLEWGARKEREDDAGMRFANSVDTNLGLVGQLSS